MTTHRLPPFMRAGLGRRLTRRDLARAAAVLAGMGVASRGGWSRAWAQEGAAEFAGAQVDWQAAKGSALVLGALQHPWTAAIEPLLPQFTALTGVEVQVQTQSETEYLAELPVKLGGGSAVPDVFMVSAIGQAVAGGWLEPLGAHYANKALFDPAWYDEQDLFGSARSFPVWVDGERYVVPITAEAQTLFMNQRRLEGMNAPETMDELLTLAKALKDDATAGIAMRAKATGDAGPWPAGGFVFTYGGEIVTKAGVCALDTPEAIAAVDMYGRMLREAGPLGVGNYHWYECLNDFMQGAAAIGCDSSNFATDIADPQKSQIAGKVLYGAMPQATADRPAKANMWHWLAGINARSKNKPAAFLFLAWATSRPTCAMAAALGLATPRASAWASDGFKQAFGAQAAEAALANLRGADGEVMKRCWFHPKSAQILDPFAVAINEVATGVKDAETAMKEATAKINAAIAA
jgi:multiple sugar transport system substrate-binding protein